MADEIKINSPEELRALKPDELEGVCRELRSTLIHELANNPGHFASSMGAVEIAVALHYVFNTPYDRIVWDVGHQAYAHKLLTGRRDRFSTNRKFGGLCGFPNPNESEYDSFPAGHASNSISAALGMSVASQLHHEEPLRQVVAVIGDASISGGLAFEGLNNVANTPNNMLIILNDNEMSIDPNVGALSRYLSRLNTSKRYNSLRYKAYKALRRMGLVTENARGPIMRFTNSIKALLSRQQNIFEGLNIRYFGPIDGNDVGKLVRVLNDIKNMEGPKMLHVRTRKGAGYEPAERDPSHWHAPGKFNPATGERLCGSGVKKWQDIFGETLTQLARKDERVVGITAAMLSGTSVSVMQKEYPERVFDVGISEGHAVTFAGGLAKDGMRPFVAIYSSFLQRGYDHMFHDVALAKLPVTFCIDRAGIVGEDGATHHGALDLAYLRTIVGMTIAAPSTACQLRGLMLAALKHDGPMAIRYPRGAAQGKIDEIPDGPLPLGKGRKLASGNDAAVLSIGPLASHVTEALAELKTQGVSVAHYDMIFLSPIDTEIMSEVFAMNVPVITVEDGIKNGGLGSAVTEWLNDHGSRQKVTRLGMPADSFVTHGTCDELYKQCGLDAKSIAKTIKEAIS